MLSDVDILAEMTNVNGLRFIPALQDSQVQPCSVDLRLGKGFIYWKVVADAETRKPTRAQRKVNVGEFVVKPGQFVLAQTLEYVEIPPHLAAKLDGKSTLGRLGLTAHITAGLIDPGFKGVITLEIKNVGYDNITLYAGQKICQLEIHRLSSPAARPYGHADLDSKYQFQAEVTEAR